MGYTINMNRETFERLAGDIVSEVHNRANEYFKQPSLLAHTAGDTCRELERLIRNCITARDFQKRKKAAEAFNKWYQKNRNFLRSEQIPNFARIEQLAANVKHIVTQEQEVAKVVPIRAQGVEPEIRMPERQLEQSAAL